MTERDTAARAAYLSEVGESFVGAALPPRAGDGSAAPATATEFTLDIARIVTDDEEAIERYVDELPREATVLALHIASRIRRALYRFEQMDTSRIVADEILTTSQVWTSPEGVDYFWAGDRHREVRDPEGLRDALSKVSLDGLAARALKAAFKTETKTYLTELDKVARFGPPEAKEIVNDFATWKEGTPKLRPVEEAGR